VALRVGVEALQLGSWLLVHFLLRGLATVWLARHRVT